MGLEMHLSRGEPDNAFIPSQVSKMSVDLLLTVDLHRRKRVGSRKVPGGPGSQGSGQLWESGWQEPMDWLALDDSSQPPAVISSDSTSETNSP